MANSLSIKDSFSERQLYASRSMSLGLLVLVMFFLLIARSIQLQVVEYDAYRTRSDENRIQVEPIAPSRGLIYDRHGTLLAENRPQVSLMIVKERVQDLGWLLDEIGKLIEIKPTSIESFWRKLDKPRRPLEGVPLKTVLSESEQAILAVNRHRLKGVEVVSELVRFYPFGDLFAHSVGSVRRISQGDLERLDLAEYRATKFIGRRGVESFYEETLHGISGYRRIETDAHGMVQRELEVIDALSGQNLTLQLDAGLQEIAVNALDGRRGAIVAIDTRSGGILVMLSSPSYDPNDFVEGMTTVQFSKLSESKDTPMFNRAINGLYSPGSTYKPIVALAGIADNFVNWKEEIQDDGWFQIPGEDRIYRDWGWTVEDSGGQGKTNLRRAIYRSSNVFFYDLVTRMDVDALATFSANFGYGFNSAIDIPDASEGLVPTRSWKKSAKGSAWYLGDNVNLGIGQGDLLVTPLQLATASTVIANRGSWVRPKMLLASDKIVNEALSREAPSRVEGISSADWELLIDAMEDVVHRGNRGLGEDGTAWPYIGQNINYRMAGKSGTAQVVEIKQGDEYDEDDLDEYNRKHAWFTAFAPADNPSIAIAVLVENGGGGSSVAGPIARAIFDAHLSSDQEQVKYTAKLRPDR